MEGNIRGRRKAEREEMIGVKATGLLEDLLDRKRSPSTCFIGLPESKTNV